MKMENHKHYYAAHNYYGTQFAYDNLWSVYAFDSRMERDNWLDDNEYDREGKRVSESVSAKNARRINSAVRLGAHVVPSYYNNYAEVKHL
jgi:hypothetical protein